MFDSKYIIIGLIIFVLIVTIPISYNLFALNKCEVGVPELEILPKAGDKCVKSREYMRPFHMDLLNQWRDDVVRRGDRFTTGPDGKLIEKSLSNTCMDCHSNKENFCDRCHNYASVSPYCWDCHIAPTEIRDTDLAIHVEREEDN
ncbi:hypothetical protein CEE37_07460 [candidate division LCP-89 bacterium B3_LCP]|uniref:Uncharacterized protein n=1 Tax=candidate division LCP-89 bacterium B3_LCP TaxID=2012998 RepID=A0A532V0Q5_UNCL8|nr:MAG: hypothetical protein CEE37_07460 [candidate division LCP-89 bacterium B3_LCP]